ncbi:MULTISPECIES: Nif11 family protein [unclassified Synechococcus]|uniref:Nif11 family protein n=1 Tax=unclassified Synechococcus TaxID=2626047 RepID=UPI000069940A|nr:MULTISPECIES: Nif11 family protein [unclassified Synechococcus]EAQ76065.1 hypothetical protein WH5701_14701 [Synechococcus sp. WH 5701]WFN58782.1 Nif11 family protein [Synechococcus sp. CCFWC 502]
MISPSESLQKFLTSVHADADLQEGLNRPEVMEAAVRVARAAGFLLRDADLIASPAVLTRLESDGARPAEGDVIDFDGDGEPDAVQRGGRWVMQDSDS